MRVLVVNAGSSSLKLSVLEGADRLLGRESLPAVRGRADGPALARAVAALPRPDAVGHRVVHGGDDFRGPVHVDAGVRARLEQLTELAPLHQEAALAALRIVDEALGGVPAVACFDTAFHATLPDAARTYALPPEWRRRWGLRRYGFHGLSHAYASRRAREWTGAARVVVCHLGSGASLAAVQEGRSMDTTMGFTPLEGLVMGTRSGTVDPGLLLWLLDHGRLDREELSTGLERESGLMGLAGTDDMAEILERTDERAGLARAVYVHRLRGAVASMAAAMGGLEALVFTGGVGERAAVLRADAGEGLRFLGVEVDAERNAGAHGDAEIGADDSRVRVLVIEAREDLEIAREVEELLGADSRPRMREAAPP